MDTSIRPLTQHDLMTESIAGLSVYREQLGCKHDDVGIEPYCTVIAAIQVISHHVQARQIRNRKDLLSTALFNPSWRIVKKLIAGKHMVKTGLCRPLLHRTQAGGDPVGYVVCSIRLQYDSFQNYTFRKIIYQVADTADALTLTCFSIHNIVLTMRAIHLK